MNASSWIRAFASHNSLLKECGSGIGISTADELLDEIKPDHQVVLDYMTEDPGGTVGGDYTSLWGQGRVKLITEP